MSLWTILLFYYIRRRFARKEVIERGAEQLGWALEKLLEMTLQAMADSEDEINKAMLVE